MGMKFLEVQRDCTGMTTFPIREIRNFPVRFLTTSMFHLISNITVFLRLN